MSEEEKKAIHLLQSYAGMTHKLTDNQGRPKLDQAIEKALNLIDKQQKEIEELEHLLTSQLGFNIYRDYISKDKIREKIKEYQNKLFQDIEENKVVEYENIIQVLEELLEE